MRDAAWRAQDCSNGAEALKKSVYHDSARAKRSATEPGAHSTKSLYMRCTSSRPVRCSASSVVDPSISGKLLKSHMAAKVIYRESYNRHPEVKHTSSARKIVQCQP